MLLFSYFLQINPINVSLSLQDAFILPHLICLHAYCNFFRTDLLYGYLDGKTEADEILLMTQDEIQIADRKVQSPGYLVNSFYSFHCTMVMCSKSTGAYVNCERMQVFY